MNETLQISWCSDFRDQLPGDEGPARQSRRVVGACWSHAEPTPVAAPQMLAWVPESAALLGCSADPPLDAAGLFSGNQLGPDIRPYAACYGGHQFGHWAGQLGDGRAMTLGEVHHEGSRWEVQLKGAGPTPYSRTADGRAVLRSSIRELVCSEAMHHLGVPTTRALCLVWTGDSVVRDVLYDGHPAPEPGAVLTRLAPSFLRLGSYEIHVANDDLDTLRALVRYTCQRFFPTIEPDDVPGLFREVALRTADLMVHWMRVGFVHGVMNTDNLSVLGLTVDYGPYGWLESYDPDWTPNTTDARGRRYRFGWQPAVAQWNLSRFGGALASLTGDTGPLDAVLAEYAARFDERYRIMMCAKLGFSAGSEEDDQRLFEGLQQLLLCRETDMTLFFRQLARVSCGASSEEAAEILSEALYDSAPYASQLEPWLDEWQARLRGDGVDDAARARSMNAVNPLYVPRNYLLHEVIEQTSPGRTEALEECMEVLRHPYTEQNGRERWARKRPDWARHKAGCSMLSCSS